MANVVEIAIRGIDEATKVFNDVGNTAEQSMREAESSVRAVDQSIQDVSNLDVDTGGTEQAMQGASESIEDVQGTLQETEKVGEGFGSKMKDVFTKVGDAWKEITIVAGTAGVGMEGFARKQGDVNATLERTSLATGVSSESLRELADGMTDYTFSSADAIDGMEMLVQKGFDTEEQFEEILPHVDNLSDATGKDFPDALESADKLLRPFGQDLDDLGDNTDQLTRIITQTDIPLGSLERNLGRVPDELKKLEFGLDDAAAGVEVFRDRGFEGKESVREFRRAVDESEGDMDVFLETIGLTADEWEEYQKSAEPTIGLTDEMSDINNEQMTIMEKMKSTISNLMVEYGEFADLASMLAPILISLGPILKGVTTAFKLFSVVLRANPIGLIITAITALIAIGAVLWKNWEEISEFLGNIWQWIKDIAVEHFGALGEYFQEAWEWMKEIIFIVWDSIVEFFQMIWEKISDIFMETIEVITEWLGESWEFIKEITMIVWESIVEFFVTLWETIVEIFTETIETIKGWIQDSWEWIKDTTTDTWEAITQFFSDIWESIVSFIENGIEKAKEIIDTVTQTIEDIITGVWNAIKTVSQNVWNGIVSIVQNIINGFKNTIQNTFDGIRNIIDTVWSTIQSISSSIWSGISGTVTGIVDSVKGSISTSFEAIRGTIEDVWEGIKSTTKTVWDSMVGLVKAPINLIIEAINGMINGLNKIKISSPKIPSWVPKYGGKQFSIGFNIPNVPSLATGGVVSEPTLAMVGDAGAGNPEIVAPQKMIAQIVGQELKNIIGNLFGNYQPINQTPQPLKIYLRLGRSEFVTLVEDITREQKRDEKQMEEYR